MVCCGAGHVKVVGLVEISAMHGIAAKPRRAKPVTSSPKQKESDFARACKRRRTRSPLLSNPNVAKSRESSR